MLHEVRLIPELPEELLVLVRAAAQGRCAQEQKPKDLTWGREEGVT